VKWKKLKLKIWSSLCSRIVVFGTVSQIDYYDISSLERDTKEGESPVYDHRVFGLSICVASSQSQVVWEYSLKWEVNSF